MNIDPYVGWFFSFYLFIYFAFEFVIHTCGVRDTGVWGVICCKDCFAAFRYFVFVDAS